MDNLLLWLNTEKTNPEDCKTVTQGQFKFTSIDTYTRIKKATEMFGPFGIGWGITETKDSYEVVQLNPNAYHEAKLVYRADLWYIWNGQRGQMPIVADIDLYFYSKERGARKNSEAWKKVKTDALTKGLSMLGFNADVYMGLFEDQDYVLTMKMEFAEALRGADAVSHSHATAPSIQRSQDKGDAAQKVDLIEQVRSELNGVIQSADKATATKYSKGANQIIKDILGLQVLPKSDGPEIHQLTVLQLQKLKEKVEAIRP